jgi:hypothetical protein
MPLTIVQPGVGGTGTTTSTGTGSAVLSNSPTLVTPVLGTPSSGALTNCTSIPVNQATGTLPVANGGTGLTTLTANNVLLGNGTSAVQAVAPGSNGNILTSNGTTWVSSTPAAGGVTSVATGNGLTGGTITSTGTLSIAAPNYGSVGSYVMAASSSGMTNQQNYSATKTVTAYFAGDGSGDFFYTTNLSGTWRWLGATVAGQYGDRLATVCVRVS